MKNLFAAFFGAAFLVMSGCTQKEVSQDGYPSRDAYASQTQRDQWTDQLSSESTTPCRITYHPMGHLVGLAGSFPLPSGKASEVADWFQAHADMLGLVAGAELSLVNEEPFYEFDPSVIRRARDAAESPPFEEPVSHFDSEVDKNVGTIYSFVVVHEGYPFTGMQLLGIVSNDQPILRGVYNGFSPVIRGFKEAIVSPEDQAWSVAEQHLGTPLTRLANVLTWFDVSWALNRVPATKELHWRLEGLDDTGNLRHIFVRSADNVVVFATPNTTSFEVHQTHMNDVGDTLWDSIALPNGCTQGTSPGCIEPAFSESIISRDILPRAVDLWYRLSSPAKPPFVWPFSGPHKAPLDNRWRQIWAIVAHNGSKTSVPQRWDNTYYFPPEPKTFPPSTVAADYFGHEYGHVILSELKLVHPGGIPFDSQRNPIPPATFTEAMCDLVGIITEGVINSHELCGAFTDFQIGRTKWTSDGRFIDYAPVSWPNREGNRQGKGRERIGRAFYNSWKWVEWWYGDRPRSVRDENFRAWWIDIMRSFALVSDFPDIIDFYAATESRLGTYALKEAGVSFRLALELDSLGLQNGCY